MKKCMCLVACTLLLGSCNVGSDEIWSDDNETIDSSSSATVDSSGNLLDFDISWDDISDDEFTDATETVITDENDDEYDDFIENSSFGSTIKIAYSGTSATVTGSVDGVEVTTDGGYVTVNSTVSGVAYELSGTASDGAFKIYSEKKFRLTLAGVTLTSTAGAAINIQSSKRVFVVVEDETTNTLTDAASYTNTGTDEDQKACLFSEGQLIFSGSGSLTINGNYKHGICSDDYVYIHAGTDITVASAASDGIHTNDKIVMAGGLVKLTVGSDGLDCEEGNIDIRGGLLKVITSGTASKAMKAETDIALSGGQMILLTSGSAEYDSSDADISSSACVKCDGNLTVSGAEVYAKSTGSAGKGINVDGTIAISAGTVKVITTGTQYIYGSLDSSAKGIKADGTLTISGGTVCVKATGGEGSEGIESKSTLTVNGGAVAVYTYDDCLNATSSIVINGGSIYCYSSGNDAIDSNGTLTISDGTIVASGTTTPEGGIDCDNNTFKITGGTLISVGGETSTPTSGSCTQRSVVYHGSAGNGTLFSIVSSDGTHVMSYSIPRAYSTLSLLFTSSALTSGTSYTIYTGGSVSGGTSFYGLTTGGTYTAGSSSTTFTASSMVTTVGTSSTGGGNGGGGTTPGGNPGGGWH